MRSVLVNGAVTALFVLLMGLIGCNSPGVAQNNSDDDNASADRDIISVTTLKAERVEMSRIIRQPATVHADQQADIYAKAAGYLETVEADIGKKVSAHETLAIISVPEMGKQKDRQDANIKRLVAEENKAAAEVTVAKAAADRARANAKKAEATLAAVESEYTRTEGLVQKKAVAEKLLDEAKEKLAAARAEIEAVEKDVALADANVTLASESENAAKELTNVARSELAELQELMKYATLTAPFDGVVIARNVDVGDLVRNSQASGKDSPPLYVVAKTDPVRVRMAIPERDATLIEIGQEVHITLQAFGGQSIKAAITRKAGGLDESTRTMLAEIDLPNADGRLLPGMFGEATITAEANKSRLVLPTDVVRYDEHGRSYVFVINSSDTVEVIDVNTGLDNGNQIEITEGLSGDERIVAPMIRRLKAGQKVRVK